MRVFTLSTLFLVPAVLIAQAPADISQQIGTEQLAIQKLIKELKFQEASAKADALIARPKPVFDTKDLKSLDASRLVARDFMNAYIVASNATSGLGNWEKGAEILEKGLTLAKENKAAFLAGVQPSLDSWTKAEVDAKSFLAEKPARIQVLKDNIAKVEAELVNQEALKKMNKAERAALQERQSKAQEDAQEIKALEADKATHEKNLQLAAQFRASVDGISKICDTDINFIATALENNLARTKAQQNDIDTFNKNAKAKNPKLQIKGNSNWVNAVLNEKESIIKLPTPDAQVRLLNRFLVLDPGNARVQKSLENVIAGKAPFEAEKPVKGQSKGKKSR